MKDTVHFLAQHGYWMLVVALLGRQACLPIPANLFLVAAGALARSGKLNLSAAIGLSVLTFLLADLAWYEAGRRFGNRMLHFLCGLSRDPESSVRRANAAFARHGVRTLLGSKFVLGLDAVAVPLAGASGVTRVHFLAFDALGAMFWSSTYAALGYVFSDQLELVATHVVRIGAFIGLIAAAGFGFYLARKFARWQQFVREFKLARITPDELREKLNLGEDILIVDLQGREHLATEPMAIPGAVRINPRTLQLYKHIEVSPSREVVLYCGSPGEFTSARVAEALRQKGVERVRPLAGGLDAWRDRGFPVTSEVQTPPNPPVIG